MIAQTSLEDLNRTAEEYFSTLSSWEHHLAKPFNTADDTPTLLTGVATMLQGLRLTAGMTVLEFGAGSGWLSRFLTQLGCRVILLDVSPSALAIAREVYERLPIIGERPRPQFLTFDGRSIDLPDGSVDRILSFHAFHHVPNPDAVLREFGRLLKPGGIAGFVEPGSRHSHDPQSQFEMRAYRVVENDVDVHAIARTARTCGFTGYEAGDLPRAAVPRVARRVRRLPGRQPRRRAMDELHAGVSSSCPNLLPVQGRDGACGQPFGGRARVPDRRDARGRARRDHSEDQPLVVDVAVRNDGAAVWLKPEEEYGGVGLGVHLYDAAGKLLDFNFHRQRLTDATRGKSRPGKRSPVASRCRRNDAGRYLLELDCVASKVTWFAQVGSQPARLAVEVAPG